MVEAPAIRPRILRGATLLTMNPARDIIQGDLVIRHGKIEALGGTFNERDGDIVDCSGALIVPGFIQTHVHLCQTLFRGLGDDLPLIDWLRERVWPLEAAHDEDSIRASTRLAVYELLREGTTAVLTMETVHHTDVVMETLNELPIYATVGACLMDRGEGVPERLLKKTDRGIRDAMDLIDSWEGREGTRLKMALAPRFTLSCTEGLQREVAVLGRERGIPIHTHASEHRSEIALVEKETGFTNIQWLHNLGMMDAPLKVAHCVHATAKEVDLLHQTNSCVLHCPSSNLKLGSGVAPVSDWIEKGLNVSLGSDGAACNNSLSALQEMRLAALLQKMRGGPGSFSAEKALAMGTIEGAKALGRDREMGSIETGKRANLVAMRVSAPQSDTGDPYGAIVFASSARDVLYTLVDGEIVFDSVSRSGAPPFKDEESILREAKTQTKRVIAKAGL